MTTLTTLQKQILGVHLDSSTADIKLGGLLVQAKGQFDAPKDFYVWSEANCKIKKSQACNLIKVSEGFKDCENPDIIRAAMRVKLAIIQHNLWEEAEKATEDGAILDTAWIKANKPEKEQKEGGATGAGAGPEEESTQAEGGPVDEVKELKAKLKAALMELKEAKSGKRVVYMLPHFQSTSAHMVLGVTGASSKTEIRKAWKALLTIHHPDKCSNVELATSISKLINNAYDLLKAA